MTKLRFASDPPFPMDYDSNINPVWNLHSSFLREVLDAPNTTPTQKSAALELLNMIDYYRQVKYGLAKKPSSNSQ